MPFFNRKSDETSVVRKAAAKVAVLDLNHLSVRSLTNRYRRAGIDFTREPVELSRADFDDDDLVALDTMLVLAGDPGIEAVFVQTDGGEHRLDADEIQSLRELITSQRNAAANGQPADLISYVEGLFDTADDPQA